MTDKERGFWEACGFVYFHSNSGWVWVYPDGQTQNIHLPSINSLDDLMKYALPHYLKVMEENHPTWDEAGILGHLFKAWLRYKKRTGYSLDASLYEALCLALEVEG
jgi:hypothetical protein